MAPKKQARKTPETKILEPPRLAGGNTLKQAQKPNHTPVTLLADGRITPTFEQFDKMKSELDARNADFFLVEGLMTSLAEPNQKLALKTNRQSKVLARFGVSDSSPVDAPMLPDLLSQIPPGQEIGCVTADGAYDTRRCHDAIAARDAHAVIPPRKNAKL